MSNRRANREQQLQQKQQASRVALTLPGFWENSPAAWFLTIENTCNSFSLSDQQ